jgi:hypothetical protein
MKYTTETIQCQPIDTAKLNHDINESLHKAHPEFSAIKEFGIRGKYAIVREPKLALIDEEFCGNDIKDTLEFDIYSQELITEPNGNKHGTIGCFPEYREKLSLAEIEPYLMPTVSLAEFSKERRKYNGRIISNENAWLDHFNKVRV